MTTIEITHYKPINKGTLLAHLNIKVPKWGNFIIKEIGLFQKGSSRWIGLPSRPFEINGEKKYFQFLGFEDMAMLKKFQDEVIKAVDKYAMTQHLDTSKPQPGDPF